MADNIFNPWANWNQWTEQGQEAQISSIGGSGASDTIDYAPPSQQYPDESSWKHDLEQQLASEAALGGRLGAKAAADKYKQMTGEDAPLHISDPEEAAREHNRRLSAAKTQKAFEDAKLHPRHGGGGGGGGARMATPEEMLNISKISQEAGRKALETLSPSERNRIEFLRKSAEEKKTQKRGKSILGILEAEAVGQSPILGPEGDVVGVYGERGDRTTPGMWNPILASTGVGY